jgi:hypothetical protein
MFQFEDVECVQVHLKSRGSKKRLAIILQEPSTMNLSFDTMQLKTIQTTDEQPNPQREFAKKVVAKRPRQKVPSIKEEEQDE